jgi:hypothetical protein
MQGTPFLSCEHAVWQQFQNCNQSEVARLESKSLQICGLAMKDGADKSKYTGPSLKVGSRETAET